MLGAVARRLLGSGWTSRMLQRILYDLLSNANTIDQISDARRIYRGRQKALSDALLRNDYPAQLPDGINLWMRVEDERAAVVQLAAAGIRVAAGTPFLAAPGGQFIRVTAGLVRDDFDAVGALLADAARA